jgi:hypothetical protein
MSAADLMKRMDERIFRSRAGGDIAIVNSEEIAGAFWNKARDVTLASGEVVGLAISFDCHYVPVIGELATNDQIEVQGYGAFRFLRELVPGGDESGLTILELGTIK